MLSKEMTESLNKHLNAEFYSSYLYLAMSSYASFKGLNGASNWLYIQAQEEILHVRKMYDYIDSHSAHIVLEAIDKPPAEFASLLALFKKVLEHEQLVTSLINKLMTQAVSEADHASEAFLQWFVTEQTEEEKNAADIIDRLKLAGDTGPGLFMIDNELASRVLTVPAP